VVAVDLSGASVLTGSHVTADRGGFEEPGVELSSHRGCEAVEPTVREIFGEIHGAGRGVDDSGFVVECAEQRSHHTLAGFERIALEDLAGAVFLARQVRVPWCGASAAVARGASEDRVGVDCRAVIGEPDR